VKSAKRQARSAIKSTAKTVRAATRKVEKVATQAVTSAAETVERATTAVEASVSAPRQVEPAHAMAAAPIV